MSYFSNRAAIWNLIKSGLAQNYKRRFLREIYPPCKRIPARPFFPHPMKSANRKIAPFLALLRSPSTREQRSIFSSHQVVAWLDN
jgi:hypothetical protein